MSTTVSLKEVNVTTDDYYHLEFLCREKTAIYIISLSFRSVWKHKPFEASSDQFVNKHFLAQSGHLLRGAWVSGKDRYSTGRKNALSELEQFERSVFFSFPDELVRQIFFLVMKVWVEKTICPAEVQFVNTAGYPTIVVYFQEHLITQDDVLFMGNQVVEAIAHWEALPFIDEKVTTPKESEIFDDAEVVEMELESELEETLNKIKDRHTIVPLHPEGNQTIDESSEGEEVAAAREGETSLAKPFLTKAYALKSNNPISLHDLWDDISEHIAHLDEGWVQANLDRHTRFAFATEALVIRNALGSLTDHLEDEELLRRHGNLLNYIDQIDITDARIIKEDHNLGTLYIFPGKVENA
jgi:hypothetical protein